MMKRVLITGANVGLGKECARQVALLDSVERVYLGCRNLEKAEDARAELEERTGRDGFQVLQMDTSDLNSVRAAVRALPQPLDGLVMNAGGIGGATPNALTTDGVTQVFAANVLGHALLVDELIAKGLLGSAVVYAGSEAMRGVRQLRIDRVTLETNSQEEITSVIDGSWRGGEYSMMAGYAASKYIAALWMSAMARRHPSVRFVTMSPGSVGDTAGADAMPRFQRLFMKTIGLRLMKALGFMHSVETGAERYVNALTDERYESGVFYGRTEDEIVGDVVDQSLFYPDLADESFQDCAFAAIHQFLPAA